MPMLLDDCECAGHGGTVDGASRDRAPGSGASGDRATGDRSSRESLHFFRSPPISPNGGG